MFHSFAHLALSRVQQAASLAGPAVYSFLLYDGSKANINTYVRVVTFAFTWGYLITFVLEIVAVSRCGLLWLFTLDRQI